MFETLSGNWKIGKALNLARNEFGVDIDRVTGIVSRPTDPMAAARLQRRFYGALLLSGEGLNPNATGLTKLLRGEEGSNPSLSANRSIAQPWMR